MSEVQQEDTAPAAKSHSREQTVAIFFLIIVAALVGGYLLSTYLVPKPKIGIINIQEPIGSAFAEAVAQEVEYAIANDDIKAVVLIINSPGGAAASGHDIYYQMRRLRESKPIVASVDIGAFSAAYQVAVGANEIYAKPASFVGNVGVIMGQPGPETLSERFVTTGPFKAIGASATGLLQKLDLLHADFRDSVVAERSKSPNPLKISPDELATGEIWIGIEAKEYGLIDGIGSNLDAIHRAAEMAGLNNYEVINIRDAFLNSLEGYQLESALTLYERVENEPDFDLSTEQTEWPSFYQLYIPLE